jgi:hypothetical protein
MFNVAILRKCSLTTSLMPFHRDEEDAIWARPMKHANRALMHERISGADGKSPIFHEDRSRPGFREVKSRA